MRRLQRQREGSSSSRPALRRASEGPYIGLPDETQVVRGRGIKHASNFTAWAGHLADALAEAGVPPTTVTDLLTCWGRTGWHRPNIASRRQQHRQSLRRAEEFSVRGRGRGGA